MIVANKKRIASVLNDSPLLSGRVIKLPGKQRQTQRNAKGEMLSDIIATLRMIADLHKQQIPPLPLRSGWDDTSYANFRLTTRWIGIGKMAAIEL
jgi:hypothetical protein